jgi:hypothetical protein
LCDACRELDGQVVSADYTLERVLAGIVKNYLQRTFDIIEVNVHTGCIGSNHRVLTLRRYHNLDIEPFAGIEKRPSTVTTVWGNDQHPLAIRAR